MIGEQNKKSEEIVKIRGHHLDFLHPLIELIDAGILDKNTYVTTTMLKEYGKEYAIKTWGLINILRDNEVKVKITTDIDDICSADCKKIKSCIGDIELTNLDNNVALHYNLRPEKIYSSRKIIKRLRKKETYYDLVHSLHINPYSPQLK